MFPCFSILLSPCERVSDEAAHADADPLCPRLIQAADSLNEDGGGDHEISKDELAYVLSEPSLGGALASQMRKNFATTNESFIHRLFDRLDRNKVC
jgi:hypothetical protein